MGDEAPLSFAGVKREGRYNSMQSLRGKLSLFSVVGPRCVAGMHFYRAANDEAKVGVILQALLRVRFLALDL
jgi:hypothetical protein